MNQAPAAPFRVPSLERRAASLYRADLPYHNFGHAMETIANGRKIVRRCREEGIRIDEAVVYYALLFHDAGYHEDHLARGFETKETYSAHLAARALADLHIPAKVIDKVTAAILSTARYGAFRTAEQKAVRAADLAGLAAAYPVFRANTEKLRREHELLTGERVEWRDWVAGVSEVIGFYLSQEIRLTSYFTDTDGESVFHRRARANLERLRNEA